MGARVLSSCLISFPFALLLLEPTGASSLGARVTVRPKAETVRVEVRLTTTTPFLSGQLKRICACESTGNPNAEPTHFSSDGSVLRGRVNRKDVGMCQINLTYHEEEAERLGIDLFTTNGNIRYARWLYGRKGAQPWFWSRPCWGASASLRNEVHRRMAQ
jgi:hypothetical protein